MRCVVTGGGGFLGTAIVTMLRARGDDVLVLGRNTYEHIEELGAESIAFDLTEAGASDNDLAELLLGADVVFHVAALAGMWGPYERYHAINVTGTENILRAARTAGVKRFVHTSSPSVTFHGHDEEGISEQDATYPDTFLFHYPATKARAEAFVLGENTGEFATTALRPHLIYGPGDPHLIPRLLARQRAGRLRRLGDGTNKVALTFVENAAAAHVQAADALQPGSANSGKAYFITDDEPVKVWTWLADLFRAVGAGEIRGSVPSWLAMPVAGFIEWAWRTFGLDGEPPITRFTVAQVSTSHWYSLDNARKDFGYTTVVSAEDAFQRTVDAFWV
ncbi:MAG: NAD-dependent epimerase/dehydratase family protein [Proteobacteria bacterium]|nr:NAD-dependent epimerase/dehydratase family protein [Pseudomonadota bacterium]MCP4921130.1 NAD-dependent epimerase/dehydratase family protein [Pseudomonadota bacterium]